jgi:hypothetical protein
MAAPPDPTAKRSRRLVVTLLLAAAAVLVLCLSYLPSLLTKEYPLEAFGAIKEPKDRINAVLAQRKLRNDTRTTLVQAFGGIFLALGAVFTWQTLRVNQRQAADQRDAAIEQLRLSRKAQIADRFTNAIGQLGDERMAIRLGGVHALERIARDDLTDYHAIVTQVLATFVRGNRPASGPPPSRRRLGWRRQDAGTEPALPLQARAPDRQAALTAIGRRTFPVGGTQPAWDDEQVVDLAGADLRGAQLAGLDLRRARLTGAWLMGASLQRTLLSDAELKDAVLSGAVLFGADLEHAKLWGADLGEARGLETVTSLAGAQYDDDTTWPPRFDHDRYGAVKAPLRAVSPGTA